MATSVLHSAASHFLIAIFCVVASASTLNGDKVVSHLRSANSKWLTIHLVRHKIKNALNTYHSWNKNFNFLLFYHFYPVSMLIMATNIILLHTKPSYWWMKLPTEKQIKVWNVVLEISRNTKRTISNKYRNTGRLDTMQLNCICAGLCVWVHVCT